VNEFWKCVSVPSAATAAGAGAGAGGGWVTDPLLLRRVAPATSAEVFRARGASGRGGVMLGAKGSPPGVRIGGRGEEEIEAVWARFEPQSPSYHHQAIWLRTAVVPMDILLEDLSPPLRLILHRVHSR